MSGWAAYPVTKADEKSIDKQLAHKKAEDDGSLRLLVRRCKTRHDQQFRSWTVLEDPDGGYRTPGTKAAVVANNDHTKEQHRQALLAIFGGLDGIADKTLGSIGTIRAGPNPWAKLFSEDVEELLRVLDDKSLEK